MTSFDRCENESVRQVRETDHTLVSGIGAIDAEAAETLPQTQELAAFSVPDATGSFVAWIGSSLHSQPMRARRIAVKLPVRYRSTGHEAWRHAVTENISRSGVAVLANEPVDVGQRIELMMALGVATPVAPESDVIFDALVVRTERRATAPMFAARFGSSRIVPAQRK